MMILLTGGTGYIASHTAVALVEAGHEIVCYDNLSNSDESVLECLKKITGRSVPFVNGDVRDTEALIDVMERYGVEAVFHFAGLKAVGESVADPIAYYDNNVGGTISLVEAMKALGRKTLVFSSSATVYGPPQYLPMDEDHPTSAMNPYGRTKLVVEGILEDIAASDPDWRVAILRYFNPVGAHQSALIGDSPSSIPNNLMPYIAGAASGRLSELSVFGSDYDTADGTGVRDYIHVSDLASGHVSALEKIVAGEGGAYRWNLGTGQGYSVLEIIKAFERANKVQVPYGLAERRAGDLPAYFASVEKAKSELNWRAEMGLDQMCSSSWAFEMSRTKTLRPGT